MDETEEEFVDEEGLTVAVTFDYSLEAAQSMSVPVNPDGSFDLSGFSDTREGGVVYLRMGRSFIVAPLIPLGEGGTVTALKAALDDAGLCLHEITLYLLVTHLVCPDIAPGDFEYYILDPCQPDDPDEEDEEVDTVYFEVREEHIPEAVFSAFALCIGVRLVRRSDGEEQGLDLN